MCAFQEVCSNVQMTGDDCRFNSAWGDGCERPEAGQLWSIKESYTPWCNEDGTFIPMEVLLLDVDGNRLRVAQCSNLLDHQDEGDVAIPGFGSFAEAWNIYTLHLDYLDLLLGHVGLVEEVEKIAAQQRPDVDAGSNLYFFRCNEVEEGSALGMPSAFRLMDELGL